MPEDRIRIHKVETLSDDWFLLQKTTFDYRRRDGNWQRQTRETDRVHAAPRAGLSKSSGSIGLVGAGVESRRWVPQTGRFDAAFQRVGRRAIRTRPTRG